MVEQSSIEWSDRHPDKANLRMDVWSNLSQAGAAIRDPVGHIPNFRGADQAADRLAALPIWQQATVVKCNPDSPQTPVRLKALTEGKRLYMAVPRLSQRRCFVELTAEAVQHQQVSLQQAATLKTALKVGRLVSFEEMEPIDLVVVGCVAVSPQGGRTGKGAGFADLELAMLRQFGLIQDTTPVVTTVHPLQLVDAARLPMEDHDWSLDWIVTTETAIATQTDHPRPAGLNWETIRADQYQKIPILRQLKLEQKQPAQPSTEIP